MILAIIFGAPLWVWPLMFFLIGYGIKASRNRETSVWLVYLIPTLGFITLNTIFKMHAVPVVWVSYAALYLFGALAGFALQRFWLVQKIGARVQLRGEWLTFVVVMVLFWGNFAFGVTRVVAPDLYAGEAFRMGYAAVVGLASGSLLGRALRVAVAPSVAARNTHVPIVA